jgi:hypothetical protein
MQKGHRKPPKRSNDFEELLQLDDQKSIHSAAEERPQVHYQESPRDPDLAKALSTSFVSQIFKLFSTCCHGLEGNYATTMMQQKQQPNLL